MLGDEMIKAIRCKLGFHNYKEYGWGRRRCCCGIDEIRIYENGMTTWVDSAGYDV
jgi:hypothetical protein